MDKKTETPWDVWVKELKGTRGYTDTQLAVWQAKIEKKFSRMKFKILRKREDSTEVTYTARIFKYYIVNYDSFLNPKITAGPLSIAVSEKPLPNGFTIEDAAEKLIADKHPALCSRNYEIILGAFVREGRS